MKKAIYILTVIGLLGAFSWGASSQASAKALFAADETSSDTTSVAKNRTVDGSAYLAGDVINVDGTVNGDVYCAGNVLKVSGVVNGDVICAGSYIEVSGKVNGDVRAVAGTLEVSGQITGNATLTGQSLKFSNDARLDGDLTAAASSVTMNGSIGRDVVIGAEEISFNGIIGRDANISATNIVTGTEAKVDGDVSYESTSRVDSLADATSGETTFKQQTGDDSGSAWKTAIASSLAVAGALVAVVGAALLPRQVRQAGEVSWSRILIAALVGLSALAIMPVIAAFTALTFVGLWVSAVVMLSWLLLIAISPVMLAYFVGSKMYPSSQNVVMRTLVGSIVVGALILVPFVNLFVIILGVPIGAGLVVLAWITSLSGKNYRLDGVKTAKRKPSKK